MLISRAGDNCRIISNLAFCNETEYAVPSNDNIFNVTQLANFYDSYAQSMYGYFLNALAQIPCEAPPTQRYSLVKNCDDCAVAYKQWLCSVTIPRCEDFSTNNTFAIARNVGQAFPNGTMLPADVISSFPASSNSSRNPVIDQTVQPGPYREILPCDNLCYQIVQSCPAAFGFGCPQPGVVGYNVSYAPSDGSGISCNYPGMPITTSASSPLTVSWALLSSAAAAALALML